MRRTDENEDPNDDSILRVCEMQQNITISFTIPPLDGRLHSFSPVVLCGGVELSQEYQRIAEVTVGSPFSCFVPKFFGNGQSL